MSWKEYAICLRTRRRPFRRVFTAGLWKPPLQGAHLDDKARWIAFFAFAFAPVMDMDSAHDKCERIGCADKRGMCLSDIRGGWDEADEEVHIRGIIGDDAVPSGV